MELEMEMPRPEGGSVVIKQFLRKLDFGEVYTVTVHLTRGNEPAQTILTTGTKGPIEGDYRVDQVEMVLLRADGAVVKVPSREVRVLLSNPYEGMSFDQVLQQFANQPPPDAGLPSAMADVN